MTKYVVKPNYNGTDKRSFDDPKAVIKYYQDYAFRYVKGYAKMIGTTDEKLEEMQWIGKLEIVDD